MKRRLEAALQRQSKFFEARNHCGIALMECGRTAEGVAQFEQALALRPSNSAAHFNLGIALARSARTADALLISSRP